MPRPFYIKKYLIFIISFLNIIVNFKISIHLKHLQTFKQKLLKAIKRSALYPYKIYIE